MTSSPSLPSPLISRSPSPASIVAVRSSIWPLLVLLTLINLANSLYTLPLNRVVERGLCREHYAQHGPDPTSFPDGTIPEQFCKIDEVQKQLAWIQGIMETTLVVCDFLVTIPFSFVAESFGILVVLWCNLIPRIFLSFWAIVVSNFEHVLPTRAIIAGPFLAVFGGDCVLQSTIFTLTSALAKDHVQRASYFSYVSSITYVVNFIGPSLASFTMSRSLWLPFCINIFLLVAAFPTVRLLSVNRTKGPQRSEGSDDEALSDEANPLLPARDSSPSRYYNAFETAAGPLQNMMSVIRKLVCLVKGRRNFQVMLASFFLTALASSDTKLLVQYISKRYKWTFAQAGYMLSTKALVNVVLLTVIIPRIVRSSLPSKSIQGSEVRFNYLCAEASIAISVVGVLFVAFAAEIWLLLTALVMYAMGSALPVFTMSLVKSPLITTDTSDIQDFSIVMLTKTLGSLVGAPLMTVLWVQAIKIGGAGLGLPYFVSACIYVAAAVVVTRLEF
ncbi:hypothetical protein BU24DRAFT_417727 [Aaosphaeria arxii CBS 175.79]|uniref:MFS general substrate transporter n=1 Tax=Aaosphaeria arxii CBS 175.79 TaxID=1450172 RepID=A0A6A5Y9Z6_9PLEO|nr:uncharacterized protein BU24DRAFT_417727 [Aaosphaeria arxii CBS 175.79]KAF2022076.1 hypothetical protein BU24DRAFT_417727 [Aaosphaeria arxii CBS 175.79]